MLNQNILDRLEILRGIYDRAQEIPDILDGLNTRLGRTQILYGPDRSLPLVVNKHYDKLDELRQLYGSEFIEQILDGRVRNVGSIDRKKRLSRLVELQSKELVTADEELEIQFLKRLFQRYVYNLAREKAVRARTIHSKKSRSGADLNALPSGAHDPGPAILTLP